MKAIKKVYSMVPALFLFVASCGHKQSEQAAKTVSIERASLEKINLIDMKDCVDSVRLIRLQTTNENQIAGIADLFFTDSVIIAVDAITESVHFFDLNGNYSHSICKKGSGPGEYINISRLMVDAPSKKILVYDTDQRKLIKYDFYGNHIQSISNFSDGKLCRDILLQPDGSFVCYAQDYKKIDKYNGGLWLVDENGKFVKFIYKTDAQYPFVFSNNWYHLYSMPNGEVGFVDQNQTSIYRLKDGALHTCFSYKLPGKVASDFKGIEFPDEVFFQIMINQEKGGFIFTDWAADNNSGFSTVINKKTGEIQVGVAYNPIVGKYFIPGGNQLRNNTFNIHTSWMHPKSLLPYLDEKVPELIRNIAKEMLDGLSDKEIQEGNPILQLLYIKD